MPRKPKPQPGSHRWRSAIAAILALVAAGGGLLVLNQFGDEALRYVGSRERYRVAFADIRCDAPPGSDRAGFLTEVRYLADHPDSFRALDEADRRRLERAFASHPWVEAVEEVAVDPGPSVTIRLRYRKPMLAVRVENGGVRLVDEKGVLLPKSPSPAGVSELLTAVPAPSVSAGSVWNDETVQHALGLVKAYNLASLERAGNDWRLVRRDGTTLRIAN